MGFSVFSVDSGEVSFPGEVVSGAGLRMNSLSRFEGSLGTAKTGRAAKRVLVRRLTAKKRGAAIFRSFCFI